MEEHAPTGIAGVPPKDPRSKANILSRLVFYWIESLFCIGVRRPLNHSDLFAHPPESDSRHLLNKFNRYWDQELKRSSHGHSPRLWLAVIKCIWWRMMAQGAANLLEVILQVVQSVFVGYIAEYFSFVEPTDDQFRDVCLFSLGLVLAGLLASFVHAYGYFMGFKTSMDVRIITTSAIYQKVLSLSQNTVGQLTTGHIVNLASNDVHRFDLAFVYYHYIWISPIHLLVVSCLLYNELGVPSVLAAVLIILQIPVQIISAKLYTVLRLKAVHITDSRVKVMNEVITGIRVIKMYAWEYAFSDIVNKIRRSEMVIIIKGALIQALNLGFFSFSLPVILFVTFSVYTSVGGTLTPKRVFTTLSLLSLVRVTSVHCIVLASFTLSEGRVAFQRIQKFLQLKELDLTTDTQCSEENRSNTEQLEVVFQEKQSSDSGNMETNLSDSSNAVCDKELSKEKCEPGVCVDRLTSSWNMDPDKPVLSDISFSVSKVDAPLMAVVGPVGAGKSSLLQCLLRELPALSDGSVTVRGSVAYASQEPWVYSATLRENILFGLEFSPTWYNTVVEACALESDIEQLLNGDLTLVGERGVTLSGGQKARVNLARAVYRNADIYLLDDPLSAVDAAVSRHIFDRCIRGLLSEQCVILVTHQLQYVQQCDTVLVLKEGKQFMYGDTSVLLNDQADIMELIGENKEDTREQYGVRKDSIVDDSDLADLRSREKTLSPVPEETETVSEADKDLNSLLLEHGLADAMSVSTYHTHTQTATEPVEKSRKARIVMSQPPEEERAHGRITMKTYYKYFTIERGHLFTLLMVVTSILAEGVIVCDDWWLSNWATCNTSNESICNLTVNQFIGVYGGLTGAVILFSCARIIVFILLVLRSSRLLHNKMFAAILRSPVLFFDTNPVGRVLNRFSKDIGFLDDVLPFVFTEYLVLFMRCTAIIITAMVSNYLLFIFVAVFLFFFVGFRWYYLKTAREVKRLEAIARSPVYSHFSTTLQGLPVIRSYSMQSTALKKLHYFQNQHTQSWYLYLVTNRWFGMRIDVITNLFIAAVAFFSILFERVLSGLDPALLGLALTYAVTLSGVLQYTVRQSAEVENLMVSAERVMGYGDLKPEACLETHPDSSRPHPDWPNKGHVELTEVTYRHFLEGPLVLKGISATILPSEKIGIVGRTGAGKSSLIATLFRLAEPGGSIKIDGVECLNLGLHDIRNKISIIPQDPVLFSGTVKYNLDPFQQYNDHDLWKALEQVQLRNVVDSLEGKLDALVTEGGANFSVGQKQLFCLARALLRRNHILVLDEATANVDLETDAIIQDIIREEFQDQTVLTIAHRLDTVMDSDKIMVLQAGEMREYGEPHQLLCDPNSYLLRLVEHTGPVAAERLKNMAQTAHMNKMK